MVGRKARTGLHFSLQEFLETANEVNFELVRILEDLRVEEHLVRFAEAKVELVLVEQLLVCLSRVNSDATQPLQAAYLCAFELHGDGA